MIRQHALITLASQSPRRQELLKGLGLNFNIKIKSIDEVYPDDLLIENISSYLSVEKSKPFKNELQNNEWIITSDTIVVIDDCVLGKPSSREDAIKMLQQLSNKTHRVITGVSLTSKNDQVTFKEITEVTFSEISLPEIEYYLSKEKPYDKAGSYGIQDWIGFAKIREIKGCYYNVMGLPLNKLYEQLKKLGIIS